LSLVAEETYLTQNADLDMNDKGFYAEWHAQAPGKLSATIFTATLMAQSEDFRSLASYADDAFQEILTPFDNREMADEWKMYIPPAAVWITIGGEALHYLCSRGEPFALDQSVMFTLEIWQTWKDRFLELASQDNIDEHCQSLSRKAADEMEQIERRS
jgi:hypothetical protein